MLDRVILAMVALGCPPLAERLALIDLRQSEWATAFNPLSPEAGGVDFYARALGTLSTLRSLSPSWGVQIDDLGRFALLALAEARETLADIPLLLGEGPAAAAFRARVLAVVTDPYVAGFLRQFRPVRRPAGRPWRTFNNKCSPLLALPQTRMLGQREHSPGPTRPRPGQHYSDWIGADWLHGPTAGLVGGLLLSALENCASWAGRTCRRGAQAYHGNRGRVPELRRGRAVRELLSELRRFRAEIVMSHQTTHQLGQLLRAVRGNAGLRFFFQGDALQAAEVAGDVVAPGVPAEAVRALFTALPVGECIMAARGEAPLRLRVDRYEDPDGHPARSRPCGMRHSAASVAQWPTWSKRFLKPAHGRVRPPETR